MEPKRTSVGIERRAVDENRLARSQRIVHVSSVHTWNDNRIYRRECRTLAEAGFDVTLIAAGTDPEVGAVRILTLGARPGRRLQRVLLRAPRACVMALRCRAGTYHLHDPELIPFIPLFRMSGANVIYDAHEDLPSQVRDKEYLKPAFRPLFVLMARLLCALAGRFSNSVVAATPTVAARFKRGNAIVVHNYPEVLVDSGSKPYENRPEIALYVGGLAAARGIFQMVDAIEITHRTSPAWKLRLAGSHSPHSLIEVLATRPGWGQVDYLGHVPPLEARSLTENARVGLVVLMPTPAYIQAIPTKLFEYMAAGLPVIASDFPLWRSIVEEAGCGLLVDPRDVQAIADALQVLIDDPDRAAAMGAAGREMVHRKYNWKLEEPNLLRAYKSS